MKNKLKKLLLYCKPYKKTFSLILFFTLVWSISGILVPLIVRHAMNEVFETEKNKAVQTTLLCAGLLLMFFIISFVSNRFLKNQGRVLVTKIESDIKTELFDHFQNLSLNFYSENEIGKLMTSITTDAENLSVLFQEAPEITIDFFVRFFGSMTVLFFLNTTLAFVLLGLFITFFIFVWVFTPKIQKLYLPVRETISDLNSNIEENLSGIKTIKSFANEQLAKSKFSRIVKNAILQKAKLYKDLSIFDSTIYTVCMAAMPLIGLISALFVINGGMRVGDVLAFMIYTEIVLWPIWFILALVEQLHSNWIGFQRIFNFLQIKPEIVDSQKATSLANIRGHIEFKDVTFNYSNTDKNIFENLNLKIKPGEYIALVGSSGVGKSTLCNLILRFYDIVNGEILIDGINIKNIKLESLHQNIGFVHQDTFLFSGTIMDNIRYGKKDAADEEVFEAAKNAFAHNFIIDFAKGYDTQVGQRGVKLSGGQKQRLAIARVFLKNPPILIFDEATSNLDNESEKCIQKSMEKLAENRTVIVVAHRLSTIRNAKRILMIADGRIVEEGTHEELLAKKGIYAEFYNLL